MKPDALAGRIENLLGSSPSSSAQDSPLKPPPAIPDHEVIARIGSGSYGEVWLARSVTGASRAVKVVWRSHFSSERPYEREFHGIVQFEPISRSHPGVVNVLHVGRDDAAGCFFYLMELADNAADRSDGVMECRRDGQGSSGQHSSPPTLQHLASYSARTLASDLRTRGRMPVTDVVALGVQLANALGHLHRHGLVHRDVKPSNVIFVDRQPKLADIGLVAGMNEARSFVGTEGFIPPEGPGTEQADVFSLGRLLYEAATGKDRCEFPMLPADLDQWPQTERQAMLELNEVLARACAVSPKRRHANVAELASDLNVILAGRSVRRAYGIERRLRHATQVSVAALAVVALAAGVVWFQRAQQRQAETHAAHERALRQRAEAAERDVRGHLYTALLEQARGTIRSGELGHRVRALDALRRAGAISNTAELRREFLTALTLPDLRFERELPIDPAATFVELDPAFERYAICRGSGPIEIRAVSDNHLLTSLPPGAKFPTYYGKWSSDGKYLAFKRDRNATRAAVEVWDVVNAVRVLFIPDVPTGAMAFHPRHPWLMATSEEGITLQDLKTGQQLKRFELPSTAVRRLQFSPDGERFAALRAGQRRKAASVYSAIDGRLIAAHEFADVVIEMDWHPNGRSLATVDQNGAVLLMDSQSGETRLLGRHKAEAAMASFSPDGRYLITGGWERELICWDMTKMERTLTIALGSYIPRFRNDGCACALIIEQPRRVLLHAFESPAAHREFSEDLGARLRSAAFSPDGRWLAASGAERMGVWDLTSTGSGAMDKGGDGARVSFSTSGEVFLQRSGEVGYSTNGEALLLRPGECSRWRVAPGTAGAGLPRLERVELIAPTGFVSMALLPDSVVLTGSRGSQVRSLELAGAQSDEWKRTAIGRNTISPDGRWFAVHPPYRRELGVYRLPGLELAAVLTNAFRIGPFQFSPRSDEVAAASQRGIEFWSTTTWQRTRVVTNFSDILYMPDGRSFWLTKDFNAAGLYDAETLEALLPLPNGTLPLAICPDGRRLAVSVDMRRLQVWDLVEVRRQLAELGLDWSNH